MSMFGIFCYFKLLQTKQDSIQISLYQSMRRNEKKSEKKETNLFDLLFHFGFCSLDPEISHLMSRMQCKNVLNPSGWNHCYNYLNITCELSNEESFGSSCNKNRLNLPTTQTHLQHGKTYVTTTFVIINPTFNGGLHPPSNFEDL